MLEGRKKGGGRAPAEAADTLRSLQLAEVALLISEGECGGLVNGLKSVYLDKVPVENPDGSRNFENVEFAYTVGTQGQAALPGLSAVQAEFAVGLQIDQASPVTRTIADPNVDHVRVTIGVPQLTEQDTKTGDLKGSSFIFAIEVQSNFGGFVEKHRATVDGKTTSRYSRAVRLELTGSAPWDIRVRRISPEPAGAHIVNRFSWDSYTTISTVKLRYPNSAVGVLRVNAQNFGRVPEVGLDWLGIRFQVPTNYDPITRVYSGAWNGTFKWAWTNNPAWVFYGLLTNERFGLGRFIGASLPNKWALYSIAQYCDGMVADGAGGFEPRFQMDAYIQTRNEAFSLLRELAAVFRGLVFWSSGAVEFAQDSPGEAELLYTPANVVDGDFSYADGSERQQHSVFIVRWSDLSQFGKLVPEVYAPKDLVARYGVREITLQAFGCTSRGQAARVARWAAYTEQYEGEVVNFAVGADGFATRPGRLFKIADPNEAGERLGGRISAATASVVTLDAPVTLAVGESYNLSVLQPRAGNDADILAEKRAVVTPAGTTSVLTVSPPFSAAPAPHTVWLLESNAVEATWWRCLRAEKVAGKNQWRITGVRHYPGKFALIEQGLKLDPKPISRLTLQPPQPASVAITETPYLAGSVTRSRVTVSWPEPARGLTYLVSWRLSNGPWTDLPATSANSIEVDGLARGPFEVSVRSVNAFGNGSRPKEQTQLLLGKTARPSNVAGLSVTLIQGAVLMVWAPNVEPDYLTTEIRVGASWEAGATIFEGAASRFQWNWPAQGAYTVWAKHFDTSLNESLSEATAAVAVTEAIYTQWNDLRGAGLPASNATSDLALVARGVQVSGNSAWKNAGSGFNWDADCYSVDSYTGGAFASAVPAQTDGAVMFGLNADPAYAPEFWTIDFALYCDAGGQLWAYEGGVGYVIGSYAANDVLAVVYDGSRVRYMRNGTVLRTVVASILAPLYLDTSFATPNVRLDKLRFGPMSNNSWGSIGQRPADSLLLNEYLSLTPGGQLLGDGVPQGQVTLPGMGLNGMTLINDANVEIKGDTITKTTGADYSWNAGARSAESFPAAFASITVGANVVNEQQMFGLNSLSETASYTDIDFAIYLDAGTVRIYEEGAAVTTMLTGTFGAVAPGDVMSVVFDGRTVRYLKNGQVLHARGASSAAPLFFDSSFYRLGGQFKSVRFGALSKQQPGNLLDTSTWKPEAYNDNAGWRGFIGGNFSAGGANYIAYDTIPAGNTGLVWRSKSGAGPSAEEGGIRLDNTLPPFIDFRRMYRFSVWVRAFADTSGQIYFGTVEASWNTEGQNGVQTLAGVHMGNPYFLAFNRALIANQGWHLLVGYIYPHTYSGAAQIGGIYSAATGQALSPGGNFWGGPEAYKWIANQAKASLRAFQYATTSDNAYADFWQPRIDLCDGSEPSLDELLAVGIKGAAAAAQASANGAQAAADIAQGAANTANAQHADLASDSKLTPVEKQTARIHWDAIQDEKPGIDARADALGITTEKAAYGAAYSALSGYVTPLLADLASTSNIVGSDYRWAFANVYATRQALLNKVAEESAKRAEWAGVSGVNVTTGQIAAGATVDVVTPAVVGSFTVQQMSASSSSPAVVGTFGPYDFDCRVSVRIMFHVSLTNGATALNRVGAYLYFEPQGAGGPPGGTRERFPAVNSLPCSPEAAASATTVGTTVLTHTFDYVAGSGTRQVALVLGRVGVTPTSAAAEAKDITMSLEVLKR